MSADYTPEVSGYKVSCLSIAYIHNKCSATVLGSSKAKKEKTCLFYHVYFLIPMYQLEVKFKFKGMPAHRRLKFGL